MGELFSFLKVKRNLINLLTLGIIMLGLPIAVNLVRQRQVFLSTAEAAKVEFLTKEYGGSDCVVNRDGKVTAVCSDVYVKFNAPTGSDITLAQSKPPLENFLAQGGIVKKAYANYGDCDPAHTLHPYYPDGSYECYQGRENTWCQPQWDETAGDTCYALCVDSHYFVDTRCNNDTHQMCNYIANHCGSDTRWESCGGVVPGTCGAANRYSCSGTSCVVDNPNGQYTDQNTCINQCAGSGHNCADHNSSDWTLISNDCVPGYSQRKKIYEPSDYCKSVGYTRYEETVNDSSCATSPSPSPSVKPSTLPSPSPSSGGDSSPSPSSSSGGGDEVDCYVRTKEVCSYGEGYMYCQDPHCEDAGCYSAPVGGTRNACSIQSQKKFKCSPAGQCIEATDGTYATDNCDDKCTTPTVSCSAFNPVGLSPVDEMGPGGISIYTTSDYRGGRRFLNVDRSPSTATITKPTFYKNPSAPDLTFEAAADLSGNWIMKIEDNNSTTTDNEYTVSANISANGDLKGCVPFILRVPKKPTATDCPADITSTQARVKTTTGQWTTNQTITLGESVSVAGFHNNTLEEAGDVTLESTGPAGPQNYTSTITSPYTPGQPGVYSIKAITLGKTGGECIGSATLTVTETPGDASLACNYFYPEGLGTESELGPGGMKIYKTSDYKEARRLLKVGRVPDDAAITPKFTISTLNTPDLSFEAAADLSGDWVLYIPQNDNMDQDNEYVVSANVSSSGDTIACTPFILRVPKKPGETTCPSNITSTEARVKTASGVWTTSETINLGESVSVAGFHNKQTDTMATDVALEAEGPSGPTSHVVTLGTTFPPSLPGTYTIRANTIGKAGGNCVGTATLTVSQPRYLCSNYSCVRDDTNGTYTDNNCGGACERPARYKCSNNSCVRDDINGNFSEGTCENSCQQPLNCSSFSPSGLSSSGNIGPGGAKIYNTPDYKGGRRLLDVSRAPSDATISPQSSPSLNFEASVDGSGDWIVNIPDNNSTTSDMDYNISASVSSAGETKTCTPFILRVPKKPTDTACPSDITSTQARVKTASSAWTTSTTINLGDTVSVAGFHNNQTDNLATDVILTATGPNGPESHVVNLNYGTSPNVGFKPEVAGSYIIAASTIGKTGGNCTGTATLTVTAPKYKCSNNACVRDDANGTFTSSNCDNSCQQPVSCSAFSPEGLGTTGQMGQGGISIYTTPDYKGGRRTLNITRTPSNASIQPTYLKNPSNASDLTFEAAANSSGNWIVNIPDNNNTASDVDYTINATVSSQGETKTCTPFIIHVPKKPIETACPANISSTQARLMVNGSIWTTSQTIDLGNTISVAGFHNNQTDNLAADVILTATGPDGPQSHVVNLNLGTNNNIGFKPELSGRYTITATTIDKTGGNCIGTATLTVNEPPVTIKYYRFAQNPAVLANAQFKPYPEGGAIERIAIDDSTLGQKSVFVQYQNSKGENTAPVVGYITYTGPDPVITGSACNINIDLSDGSLLFEVDGSNFGNRDFDKSNFAADGGNLEVRQWSGGKVVARMPNPPDTTKGKTYRVTLTRSDGIKTYASCSVDTSQISLGANLFCRSRRNFDQEDVDLSVFEIGRGPSASSSAKVITSGKEKVTISKDGLITGSKIVLKSGAEYVVCLKAPLSLRACTQVFSAISGNNNMSDFSLPVGDFNEDDKINTIDASLLKRQWGPDAENKNCDLNRDGTCNSFEWACIVHDVNKASAIEPK